MQTGGGFIAGGPAGGQQIDDEDTAGSCLAWTAVATTLVIVGAACFLVLTYDGSMANRFGAAAPAAPPPAAAVPQAQEGNGGGRPPSGGSQRVHQAAAASTPGVDNGNVKQAFDGNEMYRAYVAGQPCLGGASGRNSDACVGHTSTYNYAADAAGPAAPPASDGPITSFGDDWASHGFRSRRLLKASESMDGGDASGWCELALFWKADEKARTLHVVLQAFASSTPHHGRGGDHDGGGSVGEDDDLMASCGGGYVAFGLSEVGAMPGSDMVVVDMTPLVNMVSPPVAVDAFVGAARTHPTADACVHKGGGAKNGEDWTMVAAERVPQDAGTSAWVHLERAYDTGDGAHDRAVRGLNVPQPLVWAMGAMTADEDASSANSIAANADAVYEAALFGRDAHSRGKAGGGGMRRAGAAGRAAGAAARLRRMTKHTKRRHGFLTVNLRGPENVLTGAVEAQAGAPGAAGQAVVYRDYRFDETIPPRETTVICRAFTLDATFPAVVAVEPVIEQKDHVHHLHAHWCHKNAYFDSFVIPEGSARGARGCTPPSYDPDRAKTQCIGQAFTFTPGVQRVLFPPRTGLPIGTGSGELMHVILEIHYDNPKRTRGMADHSGFRLFYARDAPEHTIGMLGVADPFATDPGKIARRTRGYEQAMECPNVCTSQFPHPVHVVGSLMHMHKLGTSIQTFVKRKGAPAAADGDGSDAARFGELVHGLEYFDHEFQHYAPVDYVINPGDTVTTRCVYDTSAVNHDVANGAATSDEMCMNLLMYYPKIDFMMCGVGGSAHGGKELYYCGGSDKKPLPEGQPSLMEHRETTSFRRTFGVVEDGGDVCAAAAG